MLKRDDGAELFAVVKNEQPDITILQASTGSSATWQLLQFHRRKLCEEHKLQDVHVPKHEPSLLRIFDEACPGKRPYRAPRLNFGAIVLEQTWCCALCADG